MCWCARMFFTIFRHVWRQEMISSRIVFARVSSPSNELTWSSNVLDSSKSRSTAFSSLPLELELLVVDDGGHNFSMKLASVLSLSLSLILPALSFWALIFLNVAEVTIGMLIKFRITLFSDGVFRRHHSSGRCAPRGVLGTLENQTKKRLHFKQKSKTISR